MLGSSKYNHGCAFTHEERRRLGLLGRLPYREESLEEQVRRAYHQYEACPNDLRKNVYLNSLHEMNLTLFYRLVSEHLDEMFPIIYTPTVGQAVERHSLELRRPNGLYIAQPDADYIEEILDNRINKEVDLIVVTDGEGVLGIGDQGIGGMEISRAKLMVYTLCSGVNPHRVLPICLDVGTDNTTLLEDPWYLGWRHKRLKGQAYDDFIDRFVKAVQKKFPGVYLHWEDFGRDNGRRLLEKYQDSLCTFNDDMQGTGAVTLACVLAGMFVSNTSWQDQRVVIFGAGTSGIGIADQICASMVASGMDPKEARRRIWTLGRPGLLLDNMPSLAYFQHAYARSPEEVASWECESTSRISLLDVVRHVKPTILIGCSTVAKAFDEEVVRTMHASVPRPIILALSNPTSKSEAHPADLLKWTEGQALIATGSPFPPVVLDSGTVRISQSNNAFIFPGLGMGILASKPRVLTEGMISAACQALARRSPALQEPSAPLLPPLSELKSISRDVAIAVARQARSEGISSLSEDICIEELIDKLWWEPAYLPIPE